jgi:predicted amidophosphoribosyltransferase
MHLSAHAGWSPNSQMHLKYLHYFGNESNDKNYGIVTRDKNQLSVLRHKSCSNCNEPNKPDSRFCAKCRMVLTYDAYSETLESEKQKEDRVSILEKQMQSLVSTLSRITEQGQVNRIAQTLYSSGILKEGKETTT